mgnify:CR=1 FL=1
MKKDITVTIKFADECSKEEKLERQAQFFALLHKWASKEKLKRENGYNQMIRKDPSKHKVSNKTGGGWVNDKHRLFSIIG